MTPKMQHSTVFQGQTAINEHYTKLVHCQQNNPPGPEHPLSEFSSALLYAFTVYTTIGYGDPVAKTTEGTKPFLLFFSLSYIETVLP